MNVLITVLATLGGLATLADAATPMDLKLEEGRATAIECEYTGDEPTLVRLFDNPIQKGTYHYSVYVPPGYNAFPKLRYPCLFIESPTGNAGMDNIRAYAQANGWLVVMLAESRNGPSDPCIGNFLAAHDDVVKRLRIQEGRKVATGFSGGAREASMHFGMRDGFAGLILQGAGFTAYPDGPRMGQYKLAAVERNKDAVVYGLFGDTDGNNVEIDRLKKALPDRTARRFELFPGGHAWAPAAGMERALDWIDGQRLQTTKDKALVKATVLHKVLAGAPGTTPLAKYQNVVANLRLLERYHLDSEAEGRELAGKLLAQKAEIVKDADAKKEIAAYMEYDKVDAFEKQFREEAAQRRMAPIFLKSRIQTCIGSYQKVVATNPDTEASRMAAQRIVALQGEMDAAGKTLKGR